MHERRHGMGRYSAIVDRAEQMIKGVLVAFGIMVVLAIIPIVHFIGIPFGPFVGGYFGISSAGDSTMPNQLRALTFGGLLGVMVLLVCSVAVVPVTAFTSINPLFLWGGVLVFSFYTASMGALGAMYSLLRAAG